MGKTILIINILEKMVSFNFWRNRKTKGTL